MHQQSSTALIFTQLRVRGSNQKLASQLSPISSHRWHPLASPEQSLCTNRSKGGSSGAQHAAAVAGM